ncbi:uncharacterized protein [Antedon mediterranea]|uniref:uncharacterized protein n=1 Tax=Antedon mediterranea TaxID=105859 RepID=UPI003AF5A06D
MRVPNHFPSLVVSSTTFPGKLWRLVNNNLFRSIQWSPEGTSVVINSGLFKREVLSGGEYGVFKTTNFTSFIRQLNLYGFRKTNICSKVAGDDSSAVHYFQHTYFIRNRSDLLCNVRRSNTGTKSRRYENYNLYNQSFLGIQQQHANGAVYSLLMTDDSNNNNVYPYYMSNNNSNNNEGSQHVSMSHPMRSSRYSPYPVHHSAAHQMYRQEGQTPSNYEGIRRVDQSSMTGFPSIEDTIELTALLSANGICLPRYQSTSNAFSTPVMTSDVQHTNYPAGLQTERRERIQRRYVVQEDIQTLCSPNMQDTNTLSSINELIRKSSKVPSLVPSTVSSHSTTSYSLPVAPFIHQRYNIDQTQTSKSQKATTQEPSNVGNTNEAK